MNNEPNRNTNYEPWEQQTYQTGSTRPPKSHGGLIALLLVVVILLCGIISAMGLLNIRLSQALATPTEGTGPFSVSHQETFETLSTIPATTAANTGDTIPLQTSPISVENIPQEGGLSLQKIYETCIPSVVSISCTFSGGSSTGTGVVLSQDGYIVTNCHVVDGAKTIRVQFTDNSVLDAVLVGADALSDLAVLYVNATDLVPAQLGDSGALRVGDTVVAIGDPLGTQLRGTMTDGIVSAINRDITTGGRTMTLIQTNAALNSGNSGGPLLNCYGQVIGINTMKIGDYVNSAGVEGLGFAIPSTTVKDIVDQLISKGYVSGRPSLGFTGSAVSSFDRLYYRLPQGIYITAVTEGSDAQQKGIIAGDILLALDNFRIIDEDTLNTALYSYNAGDTVSALIYRRGTQQTVTLVLEQIQ